MSARMLYPDAAREAFAGSGNARPLSEVDKGELWEKGRLRQLADDRAVFSRHFRPDWDLRSIVGAKALRDVQAFVRDRLKLAHWKLPTNNTEVQKLLQVAVTSGRFVPVVNRRSSAAPRVVQPDPAPQSWPAIVGGGHAYPTEVLTTAKFFALKRANGELPALDSLAGGVAGTTLDPLPGLGAPASAEDEFDFIGAEELAAGALPGESDDVDHDREGIPSVVEGFTEVSTDSDVSNDSTALGDASPFEYSEDAAPESDSFEIAKTPNAGVPGTWYTNPGSGQMRMYGDDGKPLVDFDFDHDHGQGVPDAHNWQNGVRGPGVSFSPL